MEADGTDWDEGGTDGERATGASSRRLLVIGAAVGALLIVALVALLNISTRQRDTALGLQERSYEVMILANTLDATIARAEAALGRFVISGDKSIGGLYAEDWQRASSIIDRIEQVARDNPRQLQLVRALRSAYLERGDELGRVALRTTYRQNAQALSTYYVIRSTPTLARLDMLVDRMVANERANLGARSTTADAGIGRTDSVALALSLLGVALVAGAAWLGWTVLRASQRRRRDDIQRDRLEEAVAERTAMLVAEMENRELAEARLRQSQKLDAVGQLTGGIAHDFNNMLAVVVSGLELARRRMVDGDGGAMRHIDSAMEGATRAAALTKRLLAFARAEPLLPAAIAPDALIGDMSELLDRTLGDRIAVKHFGSADEARVFVDRHQLENALLNLAVNARDAMDGAGTLTIATACIGVEADEIADLEAGDYIRIAVSDTGTGIERDVLDRVFEPFFTTKVAGKGTGLGLSQVFSFVRQSGGVVTVDSRIGMGTTIAIYLPRHDAAPVETLAPTEAAADGATRRLAILVAEDDPRVMAATLEALIELGHRPVACPLPSEASALLDAHPDIALVVSDVLMPEATGPELVADLRRSRPELRAIFATGFAGDIGNAQAFGDDIVLRKPFTIAALGVAIERAAAP